jgi:hypothetical protein
MIVHQIKLIYVISFPRRKKKKGRKKGRKKVKMCVVTKTLSDFFLNKFDISDGVPCNGKWMDLFGRLV